MTIDDLKSRIIPLFKKRGIKKAGIFGSFVKGLENENSDVDILVEIGQKNVSLFDFIGIKLELEDALGRKVDLVEYSTIKPVLKEKILAEEIRII